MRRPSTEGPLDRREPPIKLCVIFTYNDSLSPARLGAFPISWIVFPISMDVIDNGHLAEFSRTLVSLRQSPGMTNRGFFLAYLFNNCSERRNFIKDAN